VLRDLDSPAFASREAAVAVLNKHGEAAVPVVRGWLEKEVSAEVRDRLTRFLAQHDGPPAGGEQLRRVRAVELLEHLRTVEAIELLTKLAAGGPSRQTRDAAAARDRVTTKR
jgi:hypothetical protein